MTQIFTDDYILKFEKNRILIFYQKFCDSKTESKAIAFE